MPATASGTEYGQHTTVLPMGDQASLLVPAAPSGHLVVYTHGNAGPWNQFATLPAWSGMRNWLLDNGASVVESAGAGNDWGGTASRASYEQAVAWARSVLTVGGIVVLARSMGGLVGYWLATQSNFAADVIALIVNSGTTDLAARYAAASGSDLTNMNAAYGLGGSAKDIPAFTSASVGHDPMLFSGSLFSDLPVMQLWGTADTTVAPGTHGRAWWEAFASFVPTPPSTYDVRDGGDHSTSNGSYLQVEAMTSFLTAVGIGAAPVPTFVYRVQQLYLRGDGASRYPVSLRAAS